MAEPIQPEKEHTGNRGHEQGGEGAPDTSLNHECPNPVKAFFHTGF